MYMFIDEVVIDVVAGSGGNGCMAFRREKYVPMGGPFGGSGGRGGDVIFLAESGLKTLIDLKFQKRIVGESGANGEGKSKNGKSADDIIIKVPIGTTIKDNDNGLIIADLTKHGEKVVIASGGRGGRGNVALATKSNQCPSYAEKGEPGEVRHAKVELRMLADVGLVGMPSVGKSTILSQISRANPKIASYHFTTLSPNLGAVTTKDKNTYIVADLPGLIEGASTGTGLGIKFLKHVERTKIIAHVLDMSGSEGRNPYDDYLTINKELEEFSPKLIQKSMIIIANKMDIEGASNNLKEFKKLVKDIPIFEIEAMNNKGLDSVIEHLGSMVTELENSPLYEEDKFESHVLYKFRAEKPFTITKDNHTWVIRGEKVEKLFKMTNFNTEEAYARFARQLRNMGIDEELENRCIEEGDYVRILDFEFEYTKYSTKE